MTRELPPAWGSEGADAHGYPMPHEICWAPATCHCPCLTCEKARHRTAEPRISGIAEHIKPGTGTPATKIPAEDIFEEPDTP